MLENNKLLELVMIVKNSGDILRVCLQNNKKYIDYWTIVDTGSTDNTCDIINEELKDVPGKLYYCDFIDFSQARNKSLDLSSKSCKYTIILDDSYFIKGGNTLRNLLMTSDKDCLGIKIGKYNGNCFINDYYSKRIIKSSCNFKYKYRVHEDIDTYDIEYIKDKDIFIDDLENNTHNLRSSSRFKKDIEMLLLDLQDYPDDPKTLYYLATTYYVLEEYNNSLEYFKKLSNLDILNPEYMFSAFYNTLTINYKLNKNVNAFEKGLIIMSKNKLFHNRSEINYKLAIINKSKNNLKKAEELIESIIFNKKPVLLTTIVENDVYEFFIPLLYIEIKLLMFKHNDAIFILKNLLQYFPTNQQLLNIKYELYPKNIDNIKLSDNKTIVFQLGDGCIDFWDPITLVDKNKRISGSEIMGVNLAKQFAIIGYRVIVFGAFESTIENKTYEGTCSQNVEYVDFKYFSEFALTYVIDYLIVSRQTANLCYYNNIKNVYLWVHDILPIINGTESKSFQTHKEKFKKVIAVTNWQKNKIIENIEIPKELIYVSRNAINPLRFKKMITKVPYRFIYSSCVFRGLNNLLDIFPKIKEKYPESTLYLFVRQSDIDTDTMEKIKKMEYVYLNNRVSQEELSIEFLKSDIFLYPTNFQETYCITAVEAMASKCLVATVDYCGLGEIVKTKGITVPYPIKDNIDELVRKLFFVLERPELKNHFIETAYNWAINQTYENLAYNWIKNLF
jgi:glycosyltransferase involved in cell wall biosynthesis